MSLTGFEHNLVGISIAAIGIAGLIVNKKLINKLNTQAESNKLLWNLVVSNLALIILDYPIPIVCSLSHKWAFSQSMCTYYGSSSLVFGFNIMLSVVMLSLDMMFQKMYATYDSCKSHVRNLMISFMWLNSIFFGLAPVFGWSEINYELTKTSCTVDFVNAGPSYNSYITACFVLMFVGPILVMLFCVMSEGNNTQDASPEKVQEYAENDKKIMILVIMFVLCWTPYAICYMWPLFGNAKFIPIRFAAFAPVASKLSVITTTVMFLGTKKEGEKAKKAQ